jgi:hypothetical protein
VARGKPTISRDSVFRSTGSEPERPVQGVTPNERPTRQTAVWLSDDETEWLDARCGEIRRGGWRSITRSALIRALIRSAMEEARDLGGVSGETELLQRLSSRS